ncbi:hypothetical protein BDV95DRAFT_572639 [Massariosphaeria phaeospora]|uniref:Uncharacterized protein n=1 Tax=Massariosphaeria phaeospora TaxID=100035 RepID=A0A7C8M888_9PLEO|nr:hypothetical protein BDV95DRAFT_572639 [Massariosphaeria phaeospora]
MILEQAQNTLALTKACLPSTTATRLLLGTKPNRTPPAQLSSAPDPHRIPSAEPSALINLPDIKG